MTDKPTTLVDRRRQKTIDDLMARRNKAIAYIANAWAKTEEKLVPHKNELEITEKALALYGVEVTPGIVSSPPPAVPAKEGDEHGQ